MRKKTKTNLCWLIASNNQPLYFVFFIIRHKIASLLYLQFVKSPSGKEQVVGRGILSFGMLIQLAAAPRSGRLSGHSDDDERVQSDPEHPFD